MKNGRRLHSFALIATFSLILFSDSGFSSEVDDGKREFIIGGKISELTGDYLRELCDEFEQLICEKRLSKYKGMKGILLDKIPYREDSNFFGYRVVLGNGERFFLKLSRVLVDDDPLKASTSLVDIETLRRAEDMMVKPLIEGAFTKISSKTLKGSLVILTLSTGEELTLRELEQRLVFIRKYISTENIDLAFSLFQMLNLKYDEIEDQWWISIKDSSGMPVTTYIGKSNNKKWLRMVITYTGTNSIFFDRYLIATNGQRLDKSLSGGNVKRDYSYGIATEWYDSSVEVKELIILEELRSKGGKIRFFGKYQPTESINGRNVKAIDSILKLYSIL